MEVQNISAQVFNKQLPLEQKASYYGCKNDIPMSNMEYLTTCVDPNDSDALIENAYQNQMDLSDYYKSNQIFHKMRQEYTDKTMGEMPQVNQVNTEPTKTVQEPVPVLNTIKESFGSTSSGPSGLMIFLIIFAIIIIALMFFGGGKFNPFMFFPMY